jgi:hypothetical protein
MPLVLEPLALAQELADRVGDEQYDDDAHDVLPPVAVIPS